jgi:hypothetical protein
MMMAWNMELLRDGEAATTAAKMGRSWRSVRSFRGHDQSVFCLLVHGDKLLSCSAGNIPEGTETGLCARTQGHSVRF